MVAAILTGIWNVIKLVFKLWRWSPIGIVVITFLARFTIELISAVQNGNWVNVFYYIGEKIFSGGYLAKQNTIAAMTATGVMKSVYLWDAVGSFILFFFLVRILARILRSFKSDPTSGVPWIIMSLMMLALMELAYVGVVHHKAVVPFEGYVFFIMHISVYFTWLTDKIKGWAAKIPKDNITHIVSNSSFTEPNWSN